MEGLIKEAEGYVGASGDPDVRDVGLIGIAQRMEHYEIAAYRTVNVLALRVGESAAAETLQAILSEEESADRTLTAIAEGNVHVRAENNEMAKRPVDVSMF
jgi:ferritin-like metal-binding protein YciE